MTPSLPETAFLPEQEIKISHPLLGHQGRTDVHPSPTPCQLKGQILEPDAWVRILALLFID